MIQVVAQKKLLKFTKLSSLHTDSLAKIVLPAWRMLNCFGVRPQEVSQEAEELQEECSVLA